MITLLTLFLIQVTMINPIPNLKNSAAGRPSTPPPPPGDRRLGCRHTSASHGGILTPLTSFLGLAYTRDIPGIYQCFQGYLWLSQVILWIYQIYACTPFWFGISHTWSISKVGSAYKCKIRNIYTSAYFGYQSSYFCIFSLHIFCIFD